MKKFTKVMIALLLALSVTLLSACEKSDKIQIGILNYADVPALTQAIDGFKQGLEAAGYDEKKVEFNEIKANGQTDTTQTAATQLVSSCDLIFVVATYASQAVKTEAEKQRVDTPIIFTCVTDPVKAGLVASMDHPGGQVTGVSDMNPMEDQVKFMLEFKDILKLERKENGQPATPAEGEGQVATPAEGEGQPATPAEGEGQPAAPAEGEGQPAQPTDGFKIGIFYTSSETNSQQQAEEFKRVIIEKQGFDENNLITKTVADSSEIALSMTQLAKNVDMIYIPTDNNLAANMGIVKQVIEETGVLVFGGEANQVKDGATMSLSVGYTEMGIQASAMAVKILEGASPADIPAEYGDPDNYVILVNKPQLEKLYKNGKIKAVLPENVNTTKYPSLKFIEKNKAVS